MTTLLPPPAPIPPPKRCRWLVPVIIASALGLVGGTAVVTAAVTAHSAPSAAPATPSTTPPATIRPVCASGDERGDYEYHQTCQDGQWVKSPEPRPTTTTAPPTTVPPSAPALDADDVFLAAFHERFGEQMTRSGDDMTSFGRAAIDGDIDTAVVLADGLARTLLDMQIGSVDLPGSTGGVGSAAVFALATCSVAYRDARDSLTSMDADDLAAAKVRLEGCNSALDRWTELAGVA